MKNHFVTNGNITTITINKRSGEQIQTLIDTDSLKLLMNIPVTWVCNHNYVVAAQPGNHSKQLRLHRILTNAPNDKVVDHINHNTLDNRLCNLRIATISENALNKKPTICKNRWISFHKRDNKWQVVCTHEGKRLHFGYYQDYEEAKIAAYIVNQFNPNYLLF